MSGNGSASFPSIDSYGQGCEKGGLYQGGYWTAAQRAQIWASCPLACGLCQLLPPSPPPSLPPLSPPSPPPPPPSCSTTEAPQCSNTCAYSSDGICDDGGPSSTYSDCERGSDCIDCGGRCIPLVGINPALYAQLRGLPRPQTMTFPWNAVSTLWVAKKSPTTDVVAFSPGRIPIDGQRAPPFLGPMLMQRACRLSNDEVRNCYNEPFDLNLAMNQDQVYLFDRAAGHPSHPGYATNAGGTCNTWASYDPSLDLNLTATGTRRWALSHARSERLAWRGADACD
jgi:hypothetical protein